MIQTRKNMKKRTKTIGTLLMTLSVIVCAMACDKENTPDPPEVYYNQVPGTAGAGPDKVFIKK